MPLNVLIKAGPAFEALAKSPTVGVGVTLFQTSPSRPWFSRNVLYKSTSSFPFVRDCCFPGQWMQWTTSCALGRIMSYWYFLHVLSRLCVSRPQILQKNTQHHSAVYSGDDFYAVSVWVSGFHDHFQVVPLRRPCVSQSSEHPHPLHQYVYVQLQRLFKRTPVPTSGISRFLSSAMHSTVSDLLYSWVLQRVMICKTEPSLHPIKVFTFQDFY